MDFGLILPSYRPGATAEGIEAAGDLVARLGWSTVWSTDHVLVPADAAKEYGHLFEAFTTLAYLGGRNPELKLGSSVMVVPMRNAVVLAKELASLDALTRGRVIAGVGIGWNRQEFANLGVDERFTRRGAYLDETIRLWRHLWSGSEEPFEGRFHRFDDFAFSPLPARGSELPVWVGGRDERALERAGRLAGGYQASATGPAELAPRIPVIRSAADAAGRPMPALSARVRVRFGPDDGRDYAMWGDADAIASEVEAFAQLGVEHLAVDFVENDPERLAASVERFDREVASRFVEARARSEAT